jgi:hypothetical protein
MLISKGKSFGIIYVKTHAINLKACIELFQIFTRNRLASLISSRYLSRYKLTQRLVSSIESQACLLFVHLNYNRAGIRPAGNSNLYTWAFGLTGRKGSLSLKRICDPTFNMIRGLFICIWYQFYLYAARMVVQR